MQFWEADNFKEQHFPRLRDRGIELIITSDENSRIIIYREKYDGNDFRFETDNFDLAEKILAFLL